MCHFLNKILGKQQASAKVVDGTLILSLPEADNPVIWRWDLGQVKTSALEITEQENGGFILKLKTPKGDVHNVAPFRDKSKALSALMAVSHAMKNAHGHMHIAKNDNGPDTPIAAVENSPQQNKTNGLAKWGIALACVLLVLGLFVWMTSVAPTTSTIPGQRLDGTQPLTSGDTSGVPMSADAFLNGQ